MAIPFAAIHMGANEGYRCVFALSPTAGQGVVSLTNSDAGMPVYAPVLDAIRKARKW